jgi:hypothetical protein
MSETVNESGGAGPSHRSVELGLTGFVALLGLIAIFGSLRVGIGWAAEGPQAGFFPFYVGLMVVISSAINLASLVTGGVRDKTFAEWAQLKQVMSVVIPTAVYVALVPSLGIYVSSALLIAAFMKWFGRYSWTLVIAVSVGVSVLTFFMFELWFLVPLPKGPVESLLGY